MRPGSGREIVSHSREDQCGEAGDVRGVDIRPAPEERLDVAVVLVRDCVE